MHGRRPLNTFDDCQIPRLFNEYSYVPLLPPDAEIVIEPFEAPYGVTSVFVQRMLTGVGLMTLMAQLADLSKLVAVMAAVPTAFALIFPPESTDTMDGLLLLHVTSAPAGFVVAWSLSDVPINNVAEAVFNETEEGIVLNGKPYLWA